MFRIVADRIGVHMFQGGTFWFFLAAIVLLFWSIPLRGRAPFLSVTSLLYLLTLGGTGPLIAAGLAVVFYLVAPRRGGGSGTGRAVRTVVLCVGAFALLAYFKYSPMIAAQWGYPTAGGILLPLGISYFTFKLVHYAIEVWRGTMPAHGFGDFVAYVLFFPTFTIGPIERFDHYLSQRVLKFQKDMFVEGLSRIIHGLIKRFALVDVVLPMIWGPILPLDQLLVGLPQTSPIDVWWFLGRSYILAYLEFSAYSDMAIGSSRLFGVRILENFRFPILATSISDFWQRWHMTLAGWCQAYVYMPLIGATRNPYLASYLAFTAIGLWHAATFQWLVWGLYHASGIVAHAAYRRYKFNHRWKGPSGWWWSLGAWGATQLFVTSAYSFTCTYPNHSFHDSVRIFVRLLGGNFG
ncbi:MAG: MBOAT family O-acyltransferase [Planctomycetota bacterium]